MPLPWGRKKEAEAPAAAPPTYSAPPPTEEVKPAAAAADGDMFGGMAVLPKVRAKRRGMTTTTSGAAEEHHDAPAAAGDTEAPQRPQQEAPAAPPAPFFAKFDSTSQQPLEIEVEDPETRRIRRRLERFYEEYNPSKLAQVDQTLKSYVGKEKDLFDALVAKYGPEPKEPTVEVKKKAVGDGMSSNHSSTGAPAATTSAGGFAGESWGSVTPADPADAAVTGFGGAGFTFGGASSADGFSSGGFAFGGDAATTGFTFGGETAGTTQGFSFTGGDAAAPAEGFHFGGEEPTAAAETAVPSTFSFGGGDAAKESSGTFAPSGGFEQPPAAAGFGFTAAAAAAGEEEKASSSDSSDDDDEPTLNERHRSELRNGQGDVLEAKLQLAEVIRSYGDNILKRQDAVKRFHALESDIEECIVKEMYDKAAQLDAEMQSVASEIDQFDAEEATLFSRIPLHATELKAHLKSLGGIYTKQRQELLDTKGEEERRVNKYITETSSKLETLAEKLAASLDRANRTLHNTEQEVVNIEQRSLKIQEKINDQTKGLRERHQTLSGEKETLDAEIRELEVRLQQKRRQSADKKIQITEIEEKLKIITDDFSETVDEVQRQLHEEQAKKDRAQAVVDDLTSQERTLNRERTEFDEEKATMLNTLQTNNNKIALFESLTSEITQDVPREVDSFLNESVLVILRQRLIGRSFLADSSHKTLTQQDGASGNATAATDEASPLATVNKIEAQLRRLEKELQQHQATLTSTSLRLQDIRTNIPLLEVAKKAAAQAKQFKEAQAKTEEIKKLTEEAGQCERESAAASAESERAREEVQAAQAQLAAEKKIAATKMASFFAAYQTVLRNAKITASSTTLNILRLEPEELPTDESDPLSAAAVHLLGALSKECATVALDTLVEPINEEPQDVAATETNEVVKAAAVEEEAPVPSMSLEEIKTKIEDLEANLSEAMEKEDFELCETIQSDIDKLTAMRDKM